MREIFRTRGLEPIRNSFFGMDFLTAPEEGPRCGAGWQPHRGASRVGRAGDPTRRSPSASTVRNGRSRAASGGSAPPSGGSPRDTGAPTDGESLAEQGRSIAAVGRFEAAWRAGQGPRIADDLRGIAGPRRARRLRELIRLERELRARAGEVPPLGEDFRRFPDRVAEIAAGFTDPGR